MPTPFTVQTLKGPTLTFRPLNESDFEGLFEAASDPLIWAGHSEKNRYTEPVFKKFFEYALMSKAAGVVIDNKTQKIIGSSRYYEYDLENRSVVIGYTFLTREFWGGPANQELKQLMLAHAFKHVDRVYFHVSEENARSQNALKKIGAKLHEKKDVKLGDGSIVKRLIYIISKPDFHHSLPLSGETF